MDEDIRDRIMKVLHNAYRSPKGKYRNPSFETIRRDVRSEIECEREDVMRELQYLIKKGLVDSKKSRHASNVLYGRKIGAYTSEHYELSSKGIDRFESSDKYGSIDFVLTRHLVRVLKKSDNFLTKYDYRADFQPEKCFLPIDSSIEEGDRIQLVENGQSVEEKIVGEVKRYRGYGAGLDHIEAIWMKKETSGNVNLNIRDSHISGPVVIGTGSASITVSLNKAVDIEKIVHLISDKEEISEMAKEELISIVKEDLPQVLSEVDPKKTKTFVEKIKKIGQEWLVPIIIQITATYFQHQMGINN